MDAERELLVVFEVIVNSYVRKAQKICFLTLVLSSSWAHYCSDAAK